MSNFIEQIIEGTYDSKVKASDLIKKMKIVANEIESNEILEWAKKESQGYPNDVLLLPKYRKVPIPSQATWINIYNGEQRNLILNDSIVLINNPLINIQFDAHFYQPLIKLEAALSVESPSIPWSTYAVKIYEDLAFEEKAPAVPFSRLTGVAKYISPGDIEYILDSIKDNILDFMLALRKIVPNSNFSAITSEKSEQVKEVVHTFTYNIYGNNITIGNDNTIDNSINVEMGDKESLLELARQLNLPSEIVSEIEQAAIVARANTEEARSWFSKIVEKMKEGSYNAVADVTTTQTTNILQNAFSMFLGS